MEDLKTINAYIELVIGTLENHLSDPERFSWSLVTEVFFDDSRSQFFFEERGFERLLSEEEANYFSVLYRLVDFFDDFLLTFYAKDDSYYHPHQLEEYEGVKKMIEKFLEKFREKPLEIGQ